MKPFRSGRNISIVVMILFSLGVVLALVAIIGELMTLDFFRRLSADLDASMAEAETIDSFVWMVVLLSAGTGIASFVAFLIWVYRVNSNLPALGASYLKFTPRWAVGNFFIPMLNLFRIPDVLTEIWRASDPALPRMTDVPTRKRATGTWLVGMWWATFWVARIADRLLAMAMRNDDTLDQIIAQSYASIASDAAGALYGALTVGLVWAIDRHQHSRFKFLSSGIPRQDGGMTPVAAPNTLSLPASTAGKLDTEMIRGGEDAGIKS